jgi:hypothetical protein
MDSLELKKSEGCGGTAPGCSKRSQESGPRRWSARSLVGSQPHIRSSVGRRFGRKISARASSRRRRGVPKQRGVLCDGSSKLNTFYDRKTFGPGLIRDARRNSVSNYSKKVRVVLLLGLWQRAEIVESEFCMIPVKSHICIPKPRV